MPGYFLSPATTGMDPRRRPGGLSFALQEQASDAAQQLTRAFPGDLQAQHGSPMFHALPPGVRDLVLGGVGYSQQTPGGQPTLGGMPPANTNRGAKGMLPGLRPQNPGAALNARLSRGLSAALGA